MTTSKIKIKLGAIEVEYEGTESFLKEELPSLLTTVADIYEKAGEKLNPPAANNSHQSHTTDSSNGMNNPNKALQMTTGAIAARLKVASGGELILAAAARLILVEQQASFPRQRLIDEMKTATAYFRPTYVSNLSAAIKTLLKDGKLNEPSKDTYALTPASEQELRTRLA
jgi:hypothetical protein